MSSKSQHTLVLLTASHTLTEAYVIKGKLASEGIPCAIFDENTYAANPFYSLAMGGIRVMVNASDYERAYHALKEEYGDNLELSDAYLKEKERMEVSEWVAKAPAVMDDIELIKEVVKIRYLSNDEIWDVIDSHKKKTPAFWKRWF